MSAIVTVALPVFAVIALGIFAGRAGLSDAGDAAALNRFVFRFGFPAALFALMSSASGIEPKDGLLMLAYGAPALCLMVAAYIFVRMVFILKPEEAGAHAFASVIGNAVFLGLPIALAIEDWSRPFVTLMLVEGILVIGAGAALMTPRTKDASAVSALRRAVLGPLRNPLVMAALAGFSVALAGIDLPAIVRAFLDLVARAAGPVGLFSLGLFLATRRPAPAHPPARRVLAIAFVKLVMLPVTALVMLGVAGVDDPAYRGALALFTAVPTAVAAYVMASQYGRYVDETAAAIAVTTALSVVTISIVILVFA